MQRAFRPRSVTAGTVWKVTGVGTPLVLLNVDGHRQREHTDCYGFELGEEFVTDEV